MRCLFALFALAPLTLWPSAWAASAYSAATPTALLPWATCTVGFIGPHGVHSPLFRSVPVAQTVAQQQTGLKVAASGGLPLMLFTWSKPAYLPFWMKDVAQPLSVAYIDPNGAVSRISRMVPESLSYYWPPSPMAAGMEAPTPLFAEAGVKVGWKFYVKHCSVASLQPFQLLR